jgi:hypothetical protein
MDNDDAIVFGKAKFLQDGVGLHKAPQALSICFSCLRKNRTSFNYSEFRLDCKVSGAETILIV